jgi:hypothetical protein
MQLVLSYQKVVLRAPNGALKKNSRVKKINSMTPSYSTCTQ